MAPNHLIAESSPYLLQHANNPVDWYPWGEEAFTKAKAEDKLILLSIGYSACHWCHVMEHESFEDEEVARQMNDHFVCIKVDREERPDVDQIYMEAVQMISGRGGWPLNCFALPDGQPVWGGTYFNRQQWMEVLNTLSALYKNERAKILLQAEQLTKGIQQQGFPNLDVIPGAVDEPGVIKKLKTRFDLQNGGLGAAPKFPMPVALNLILQLGYINKDAELLGFINLTLSRMASGGIYDQLGGGFARYSVDERWFAPHFEKMLYDNAQLIALYSQAYKLSSNPAFKRIVLETFRFIKRELCSAEGAFYSALDADSEGAEGRFYTWTYDELQSLLKTKPLFFDYFNIQPEGNWEKGLNILHAEEDRSSFAKSSGIEPQKFESYLQSALQVLLKERNKRIRPGLDDKILTAWNALMISALCDAYQAFGDREFLSSATKAMQYLIEVSLLDDGRLHRTSKKGKNKIDGFLDDYAFFINALINLYQVTFNEDYILRAISTTQYVMRHFYDEANGVFYYTSVAGESLVARKTEIQDNVIPSSTGTMVQNLILLSRLMHLPEYENIADMLLSKMHQYAGQQPSYYAQWVLLSILQNKRKEIVICGTRAEEYREALQKTLWPGTVYAGVAQPGSELDIIKERYVTGKTLIYQCTDKVCDKPVENIDDLSPGN